MLSLFLSIISASVVFKTSKFLLCVCCIALSGCSFHKDSSYEPEQNGIVNKLTDVEWVREYDMTSPANGIGITRESWILNRDGSGTRTIKTTYETGRLDSKTTYFMWLFTSSNYNVVYMNYPCYWLIKELTYDNLHIQQSSIDPDRLTSGDYRVDKEFVAVIPDM